MKIALCIAKTHGLKALQFFLGSSHEIVKIFSFQEKNYELSDEHREIKTIADRESIPFQYGNFKSDSCDRDIDLVLAIKWRFLFDKAALQGPKLGVFVIHDSLLPKYRGASAINWALIHGEKETGATLFKASLGMDEGPILAQRKLKIEDSDNFLSLQNKMIDIYQQLLSDLTNALKRDHLDLRDQDHSQATYGCKRLPEDGLIDWNQSAEEIHNLIRALSDPAPGAFTWHDGKKVILWDSRIESTEDAYRGRIPGRILSQNLEIGEVRVLCGRGILVLRSIEMGHRRMVASEVFSSNHLRLGKS